MSAEAERVNGLEEIFEASNEDIHFRPTSNPSLFRRRLKYYFPILSWIPKYQLSDLFHDVVAGISVAFLLIPQSLSYSSTLANLPPMIGMTTALIPTFIYTFFGTSRHLSVGPEALISLLTGSAIGQYVIDGGDDIIQFSSTLTFMVGCFSFLMGLVRLGFIDSLLSKAVLCGFIVAVGVVIIIEQLPYILGLTFSLEKHELTTIGKFVDVVTRIDQSFYVAIIYSIVSIVSLILFNKYSKGKFKHFPFMIILVTFSTLISFLFRLDKLGLGILGSVEAKWLAPSLPIKGLDRNSIKHAMSSSLLISIIGFVESIAAGKRFAQKNHYAISANRELVAMGIMNIVGSFFHTYPSFGSLSRTVVNENAKSQLSGFISSVIILFTTLFFLPLFKYLPRATMSSVIFVAALKLFEFEPLNFIWQIKAYKELCMFLGTFLITLFISVEAGVIVAVCVSIVLVIKHSTYPRFILMGQIKRDDPSQPTQNIQNHKFKPISEYPYAERVEKVLIVSFHEPLFFGNTGQLQDRLRRLEELGDLNLHPSDPSQLREPIEHVIFDIENLTSIDASATHVLLDIIKDYKRRNIGIHFVKCRNTIKPIFLRAGIMTIVGTHCFFRKIAEALRYIDETDAENGNGISRKSFGATSYSTYRDL
ncbi:sulfate transporter domain-containing protein [Rozella allomycis CSF55]|uniref:Sulfate transporter domain-containing protein n=1 Tax=Rozella allomycis (strain CSF55) TaxID=988480 RepID=A0A075AWX3_ROZAC|nr:sulfate transporter domain-containing protein [Rozella allomycis CSF55]|eukprot:EPZ33207.1 sulfate transporter domain-containing protein [Rozella allomycis CSF55]